MFCSGVLLFHLCIFFLRIRLSCSLSPRDSNCGPSHTVWLCSMCYRIFPRSQPAERKPGCDLLQHGTAGAVAHASATRRVVPPTLSVEKPLVGKVSAALPFDGRESRRRETGDHMPGRRCLHDFAGGAVVKVPSL